MDLVKKITSNNTVATRVIWFIIISILVLFIGYMFGKFAFYLTH
jgi:hypothetical protein